MIQDYAYYENRLNNPFTEQWEVEIFGRECPSELLTKAKSVMPKKFHYSFLDNPAMPQAWIDEFIDDELFARKELLALRIIQQGWLQEKYRAFVEERIFASNHRHNFAQSLNLPIEILERLASDSNETVRTAVADNPNTPKESLERLAKDGDEFVRRSVASNPNTPKEVLRSFAKDGEVMVIAAMAENPNVPPDLLDSFASNPSETVRGAIAANFLAPPEILEIFLDDKSDYVRAQLARNPNISANAVEKLISDPHEWVRVALIARENLSIDVLKLFAKDKVNNHREILARKANLPVEIQEILVKDKSALVRAALAANPSADVDVLMKLLDDKSRSVIDALKNEMIWKDGSYIRYEGREKLWTSAKESSKKVEAESKKKTVAGRSESLQTEVFDQARYEELMQDKAIGLQTSATLRAAELGIITFKEAASFVEKHAPQTTAPKNRWVEARMSQFQNEKNDAYLDLVIELRGDEVLALLFNEKEIPLTDQQIMKIAKARLPITNWQLGKKLELNEDLLDELAETASWSFEIYGRSDESLGLEFGQWEGETTSGYRIASYPQALAANHPKTRKETLEKLKKSRSKFVRGVILQREDFTNTEDVKKAAKDKDAHVRQIVASHPLVTLETLEKLANDKDPEVRKAAIAHPLATPEMKAAAALLS
jgi:hypothetical protein